MAERGSTVGTLRQQYIFAPAKWKDCYLAFIINEFSGSTTMASTPPPPLYPPLPPDTPPVCPAPSLSGALGCFSWAWRYLLLHTAHRPRSKYRLARRLAV